MGRTLAAIIALSLVGVLAPQSAVAQVEFTDSSRMVGTRFNGFNGSGFAPTPSAGQLDSDEWIVTGMSDGDLAFGATGTTGDYARGMSNGGVGTGGVYAFNVGSSAGSINPALGAQPTGGDFTPGSFVFRISNNGSAVINSVMLSFSVYVLNNGDRSTGLRLGHSIGGGTVVDSGLMRMTPAAASSPAAWTMATVSRTITATIPVGSTIEIHFLFDDVGGSGTSDEIAIDDVLVVAPAVGGTDAGVDAGPPDAGSDAGFDAGFDGGFDAGTTDAGTGDSGTADAGATDAGAPVDAGPDASTAIDAGDTMDSGTAVDAGDTTDAGSMPSDGGDGDGGGMSADAGVDAGVGTMEMDSGCGCNVPGPDRGYAAPLALLGLLGVVVWRRRRRG